MFQLTKKTLVPLAVALMPLTALHANTNTTPKFSDPTYIIVGYAPGGASDRAARFVSEQLQDALGVTVLVENKTGAGGRIAAQYTKNQPSERDTLMIGNPAVMVVAPLVFNELSYDPQEDFTAVAGVTDYTFGIAVAADSPWENLDELLAWAKDNPEEFNIAVPAYGSLPHFFALMLAEQAEVDAEAVGYRGSAPALNDLMSGEIPVGIDTIDILTTHHGDRLRILATSGDNPDEKLPGVPTFKESGLNLSASGWNALFAPSTMDSEKVTYLGDQIKEIMSRPEIQKRFNDSDLPPVQMNSQEVTAEIKEFTDQWAPIIKASGYKVD